MRTRHEQGVAPFVLLLGAGASVPSNYPTGRHFVEYFLNESAVHFDGLDDEEKRRLFDKYWARAGETTIDAFIKKTLPEARPSAGYQVITTLAQEGYFKLILTTNVDSLLDQAFAQRDQTLRNHQMISFPDQEPRRISDLLAQERPQIKVLKLHGDMRSGRFLFTAGETAEFPDNLADNVRHLLDRDLIIVGYSFDDEDLRRCMLTVPSEARRSSVYYVNPEGLTAGTSQVLARRVKEDRIEVIEGEAADFDHFFTELITKIKRLDPRSFVTFRTSLQSRSLEGLTWIFGRYWTRNSCLVFGTNNSESALAIRAVWLGEAQISVMLRVTQARHPDDWVGLLVGSETPFWNSGYLVYLREDGSLEIRPPTGFTKPLGKLPITTTGWINLRISYTRNSLALDASIGDVTYISESTPIEIKTEGNIFLYSYFAETLIKDIQVTPML